MLLSTRSRRVLLMLLFLSLLVTVLFASTLSVPAMAGPAMGTIVLDLVQVEAAVYRADNIWPPTSP